MWQVCEGSQDVHLLLGRGVVVGLLKEPTQLKYVHIISTMHVESKKEKNKAQIHLVLQKISTTNNSPINIYQGSFRCFHSLCFCFSSCLFLFLFEHEGLAKAEDSSTEEEHGSDTCWTVSAPADIFYYLFIKISLHL